jgi:hypothetical protein
MENQAIRADADLPGIAELRDHRLLYRQVDGRALLANGTSAGEHGHRVIVVGTSWALFGAHFPHFPPRRDCKHPADARGPWTFPFVTASGSPYGIATGLSRTSSQFAMATITDPIARVGAYVLFANR